MTVSYLYKLEALSYIVQWLEAVSVAAMFEKLKNLKQLTNKILLMKRAEVANSLGGDSAEEQG